MNIILKIARAEIRSLFYSPIAWIVGIVFLLIAGLKYTLLMHFYASLQEHMKDVSSSWTGIENSLSSTLTAPLFETVCDYMYLFIPLLTMGVINKEVNAGTIKLLYSSPVKPKDIVLGKFFGLLGFAGILMVFVLILLMAMFIAVDQPDFMVWVSAVTGIYLLTAAYIAIGIFISSLTNYQIVAGIVTFLLFFLLNIMGGIWQQYDLVRDLTWFLSISGRVQNFYNGLITSRDLCYFLLLIGMFIGFSLVKLQGIYEKGGWKTSLPRYLIITGAVLVLGYLSSRPGYVWYADLSRQQVNTLHPVTKEIVSELGDDELTVTLYSNLFDPVSAAGMPQNRNNYIWKFWEKYQRFHPNIRFRYVYYYDVRSRDSSSFMSRYPKKTIGEVAEELCEARDLPLSLFKDPREIRKMIDLDAEEKRLVMLLEYRGRKAWLRTFPSSVPWPDEQHVSASISRLLRDSMPELLFTGNHLERSPFRYTERDYYASTTLKMSRFAMINLGADVDTINLLEKDIPATTSALIVADPRTELSGIATEKIEKFISNGGNAMFYAEPGKQYVLNPLLSKLGVHLDAGTIVNPGPNEMPHILMTHITDTGSYLAGEFWLYQMQIFPSKKQKVKLAGATAISYSDTMGFRIEPIHYFPGSNTAWIENGTLVVDSAAPGFSAAEGDIRKGSYVTGVKITRNINGKEQRIIVTGDADYATPMRQNGGVLGNSAYSWLLYNEFPKYTNRPVPPDTKLLIGGDTGKLIYITYLFLLPGLLLILGIIILIRRSRK